MRDVIGEALRLIKRRVGRGDPHMEIGEEEGVGVCLWLALGRVLERHGAWEVSSTAVEAAAEGMGKLGVVEELKVARGEARVLGTGRKV